MTTEILVEENPFLIPKDKKKVYNAAEISIKTTLGDLLAFTEQLIVNSEVSYRKITSMYRQARGWKKSIEAKRKELTEPLRKRMAAINDKAKEVTDPLDRVIDIANAKANVYQRMLEDQRQQEEEKLRASASLFDAQDEIYVPPIEKVIRGDGAVAVTKTEKKFKVLDLTQVPLKYLKIDEKSIEQDIKLGINSIPGIEIYEETTTQLRVR